MLLAPALGGDRPIVIYAHIDVLALIVCMPSSSHGVLISSIKKMKTLKNFHQIDVSSQVERGRK